MSKEEAQIRLDEHDRACLWCAQHPDRCPRAMHLIALGAVDVTSPVEEDRVSCAWQRLSYERPRMAQHVLGMTE